MCSLNRSQINPVPVSWGTWDYCSGCARLGLLVLLSQPGLCLCVAQHPPALERRIQPGGTRNVHQAVPAQTPPFSLGSACPAALSELIIPAPNSQSLWAHSQIIQREKRNLSHGDENHAPERWWLSRALQDPCQAQDQGLLHRQCKESTH